MGRCSLPVLNSFWISVPVGTILGFLSGLGIGGGSLLMLWLTVVLGMDHSAARSINLLFFIPSALVASFFNRHRGVVSGRKLRPATISGVIAALIFSWLGFRIQTQWIRKLFGVLLIATGIRELFYRPRNAR